MINESRLSETFIALAKIDSISKEEFHIAQELKDRLVALGCSTRFDGAGEAIGGSIGNLVATFPGNVDAEPIFLSAHMDTVEPGRGVKPVFEDGIFKTDGTTILGGDDKSGIAAILEVLSILKEGEIPHGPIEIVFTIAEEIGLLGAKNFDVESLASKIGYVLDSNDVNGIVTRAPANHQFTFTIHGKEAHAGNEPEAGINAIQVAARAIAKAPTGRLDEVTTCNIGLIEGGTATNIVPNKVVVRAEARGHDPESLKSVGEEMVRAFRFAVAEAKRTPEDELPRLEVETHEDFPHTRIPEDHRVVGLARRAAENLGRSLSCKTIGGGADANVFFNQGVMATVIGTGMTGVHTVRETLALADMKACAELVLEIVKLQATGE